MRELLQELGGDLDAAIRAYHRGARRVREDPHEGIEYLETIESRRRRYIRNEESGPTWDYLWRRDRAITDADWPWMRADEARRRNTSAVNNEEVEGRDLNGPPPLRRDYVDTLTGSPSASPSAAPRRRRVRSA
jgi:hypothetical protein